MTVKGDGTSSALRCMLLHASAWLLQAAPGMTAASDSSLGWSLVPGTAAVRTGEPRLTYVSRQVSAGATLGEAAGETRNRRSLTLPWQQIYCKDVLVNIG